MTKEEAFQMLSKLPRIASTKSKFIVLYLGMMGLLEELDRVIIAAEKLKNQEKIVFLFIGEGEEKRRLVKLAEEKNLKNVLFIDKQHWELMPYVINIADLCLVSLMSHPFMGTILPKKVFEYLACGKPIVSFCPVGEVTNLVEKWNAGVAVDPADIDGLAAVIINRSQNLSLNKIEGRNARIIAEKRFSLAEIGKKLDEILQHTAVDIQHHVRKFNKGCE
jgi:glycosyltransferase involved in cell wall biosynthesis